MPASKIMSEFRAGRLHSGKGGPVVKSKAQARAILLSELRREGHDIPMKKNMAEHINSLKAKGKLKTKKKY